MNKCLLRVVVGFSFCYISSGLQGAAELPVISERDRAITKIREIIALRKEAYELCKYSWAAQIACSLNEEAQKEIHSFKKDHSLAVRRAAVGKVAMNESATALFLIE